MITLAVTIILLAILSFTVMINLAPYGNEKRRVYFESDLKSLKEEVDQYYARYGELPILRDSSGNKVEYDKSSEEFNAFKDFNDILEDKDWNVLNINDRISNSSDSALAPYYIIDTELLDVDLNYKNETFIINSQSHTIYLPGGITYAEGIDENYDEDKVHYRISEIYTEVSGNKEDATPPTIHRVDQNQTVRYLGISEVTSKSFKITAKAQDTDSGLQKILFHYKRIDDPTYKTIEYLLPRNTDDVPASKQQGTKDVIQVEQICELLKTGENYEDYIGEFLVYVDVYDMAGNKSTLENDPEQVKVPPVDEIEVASLSTDWTNKNVIVTLPVAPVQFSSATGNKAYKKEFITQYKREGIDTEWQTYFQPNPEAENMGYDSENPPTIVIDRLTTLKYRYTDGINGGKEHSAEIKIDKEPPTVDVNPNTPEIDQATEVIYGDDISVKVQDIRDMAKWYGASGVEQWQINKNSTAPTEDEKWQNLPDENKLTEGQTIASTTSEGHIITIVQKANTDSYLDVGTYYVWARDNAGNVNAKDAAGNINENITGVNLLIAKIVINPKSIQGFTITLNPTEYDYDGTAKEPTVTVKDGEVTLNGVKEGEDTTGKDFTYRYENNINAGTARVIITGINNYTGVEDSATFIINKATPTLTVEIEGTNSYKETLTANATTNSDGEVTYQWWYSENAEGSNPQMLTGETNQTYVVGSGLVGKYIGVTVNVGTGTNYYATGKQDITDISNTTAPVEPRDGETHFTVTLIPTEYTYDGQAKEPTIVVKDGETTLIGVREGEDTTGKAFTYRYENNTNAGTATVVITGVNDYKGTVNKNFTINKADPEVTVTITGKNINGQTLTANATTESDGQKTYQWWYSEQADGSDKQPIPGATAQTYTLDDTYLDKYIEVTVSVEATTNYNTASGQDITDAQNNLSPTVIDIYTITLDSGEATNAGTTAIYETYSINYTLTKNGEIMTTTDNPITPPTKTGYTFGGYYTEANGAGTQYINETGFLTSSADNRHFEAAGTLYAKWTAHTYTVDFYPNLQGRLPVQYQEVEYIQNTAADAYINTGVTPTNTLKTEIVYTDVAASGSNYVLGSRTGSGGSIIYYGLVGNAADKSIGAYYNSTAQNKFPITRKANEKYDAILEIQHDEENGYRMHSTLKDVTANNSYEQYSSYQAEGLTGTPPNLYVFAIKPDQRHQGMKLHSLQFWDTSTGEPTLIRDFVPCYRISDDKIGLYDLVNDEFHEGVGTFTKGENVTIDFEKQTQQFTYGVAQNLRANTFTRTGYTFTGWNTKQDGSGTSYSDEQEVSNLTAEDGGKIELYAQWSVNNYVVKFDKNEGTGTMADMNFIYGESKKLTPNAFTRTGYTFTGWNTEANGIGTSYLDNEEVRNLTAVNNGEVTLYAQWKVNKYSIEFNYPLPSEYQQVEYIESTGNAYIDTGVAPTNTLKTDMVYMDTAAADSNYVLGSRIGEAGSEIYYGLVGNSGDLSIGAYYNSANPKNFPITRVANEKYHVVLDIEHDTQKGYTMVATLDDITASTSYNVQTNYYQNGITETVPNIYVFGIKQNQLHKGMRLYALKFYDNGVLIRNYIPCYRVADGVIGLYDMVEGGFYTHENLVKGPDEENEYHEKKNQQFTYGIAQNLTKNTFEREGYTFTGWNTMQDGTGTHYDDEAEIINLSSSNGEIINLYVQWEETKATDLTLDKETINLVYGDTATITGTITPSDTFNKNVSWTTSDATVCNISQAISTSGNPITLTTNKVGTATITGATTDGTNISKTCTVTVTAKDITVQWDEQDSWVYDGSSHIPTATTTIAGVNGEEITITITGAQTNANTEETPKYTATATITNVTQANGQPGEISNYNLTNPTKEFTITKASMEGAVTITGENTFGSTLTAEVSNLAPADATLTYQWFSNDSNSLAGGTPLTEPLANNTYTIGENLVGKYIYVVVSASKENYNDYEMKDITDTSENRTDTVAPKKITPPTPIDKIYNGQEQTSFEGTADYDVTGNTGINADNYEGTAVLRDKQNTVWADNNSSSDKTLSWIIEPAEITLTWEEPYTWVYDGNAHVPTVTTPITGVNGETITLTVSGEQTNANTTQTPNYTATATISSVTKTNDETGDVSNYTITNPTKDFTITKASITGSVTIVGDNTQGSILTAQISDDLNPADVHLDFQWYYSDEAGTTGGTEIAGATSQTYTLPQEMIGKHIYVIVTASKDNYNTTTFKDDTDTQENKSATVKGIYTITLDNQGADAETPGTQQIYQAYAVEYTLEKYGDPMTTQANAITTPEKIGYTFGGYYTGTNGTGVQYISETGYLTENADNTHFEGDGTLYAYWAAYTYTIEYYSDGIKLGESQHAYGTAKNLTPITQLGAPPIGYDDFEGWAETNSSLEVKYTNEQSVSNLTTTNNDVKQIHAIWSRKAKFYSGSDSSVTEVPQYKNTNTYSVQAPSPIEIDTWDAQYWRAESKDVHYGLTDIITDNVGPDFYAVYTREIELDYQDHFASNIRVTFDAGEGTVEPDSKLVAYNGSYGVLPTPTRDGNVFRGWYTGENGTGTQVTAETIVTQTAAHTLYARWIESTFTVTVDANGGIIPETSGWTPAEGNQKAQKIVTYNELYGTLPTPTKTGYTFEGWYTDQTAGTKVDEITTVTAERSHTLYAHWRANKYIIRYHDGSEEPQESEHTFDTPKNLSTIAELGFEAETGFTFAGWATEENSLTPIYTDGYNVKNLTATDGEVIDLYAVWKRTVNFYSGENKTLVTKEQFKNGDIYRVEAPAPITINGWTALGWRDDEETGEAEYGSQEAGIIEGNVGPNFYAVYSRTANFYSGDINTPVTREQYKNGDTYKVEAPAPVAIDGWETLGWRDDTQAGPAEYVVAEGETINGNVGPDFYAAYSREANFYSGIEKTLEKVPQYKNRNNYTVQPPTPEVIDTWDAQYWRAEAKEVHYTLTDPITDNVGPNFYAVYDRDITLDYKDQYEANIKVIFDAGEGTVTPTNKMVAYNGKYGELPTPDRANYLFKGWYTEQNGEGTEVTKETIVTETDDHTIYAKWQEKQYTVTVHANGGTIPETISETSEWIVADGNETAIKDVTYANEYGTLPIPTRTGYTFDGWYTGQTDGVKMEETTKVTAEGDHTLYAHWTANTYKVRYHSGSEEPKESEHTFGTAKNLSRIEELGFTETDEFTFAGWATEDGSLATEYANGESVTNLCNENGDIKELYAVWQRTARFHSMDGQTTNATQYLNGETCEVVAPELAVVDNWTVKGWRDDTAAGEAEYAAGDTIRGRIGPDFYAVYTRIVNFYSGDSDTPVTREQYRNGENYKVEAPAPVAINGWETLGWRDDEQAGQSEYATAEGGTIEGNVGPNFYAAYSRQANFYSGTDKTLEQVPQYKNKNNYKVQPPTPETIETWDAQYWRAVSKDVHYNLADPITDNVGPNFYAVYSRDIDLEYHSSYEANVKVNFNAGEGSVDKASKNVAYNSTYGELPVPTRTGYTFGGWYTAENGVGTQVTAGTIVSQETEHTLYAKWMVTINYHNGSELISYSSNTYGAASNLSTVQELGMSEEGYTDLYGWGTSDGTLELTYTDGQSISPTALEGGTIDLYAIWTRTANFHSGSEGQVTQVAQYKNGETCRVEVPTPIEIATWDAQYWRTEAKDVHYNLTDPITDNVGPDFYAVYSRDITLEYEDHYEANVTVNFNAAGGNVSTASNQVAYNSTYGTLPTPTKAGYVFGGWYTGENGTGTQVTAETLVTQLIEHTLYAKWIIGVNYYNNGELIATTAYTNGTASNLATAETLGIHEDGYTSFYGWATSNNTVQRAYTGGQSINEVETNGGTIDLHAVWTRTANFHSGSNDQVTTVPQYKNGETCKVEVPTPIAIETWDAQYWRAEAKDVHYNLTDPITNNVGPDFYAVYSRDIDLEYHNEYEANVKVNFNAAGGNVSVASNQVAYNSTYGTLPTPTKAGYVFGGWYTGENGTGTQITAQTTVTQNAEHTLYANWVIGVNFYNGGTLIATSAYTNGAESKLATAQALGMQEDGYTSFYGWATSNGSLERTYTDGQSINEIATNSSGTIDLYAIWTRDANFYSGSENQVTTVAQYKNGETCSVQVPTPIAIETWNAEYWRAEAKDVHYNLTDPITDNVGPDFYAIYNRNLTIDYQNH